MGRMTRVASFLALASVNPLPAVEASYKSKGFACQLTSSDDPCPLFPSFVLCAVCPLTVFEYISCVG